MKQTEIKENSIKRRNNTGAYLNKLDTVTLALSVDNLRIFVDSSFGRNIGHLMEVWSIIIIASIIVDSLNISAEERLVIFKIQYCFKMSIFINPSPQKYFAL